MFIILKVSWKQNESLPEKAKTSLNRKDAKTQIIQLQAANIWRLSDLAVKKSFRSGLK